ncbi:outer membrane beta-barrel family protein [Chryseobacterium lactis]|uniref:outer membrane beta-barrel family protein n=1 Tax=Chryseobacterium lactis TaxID=1241981 RepID=UPI001626CC25|nr:outer membrane beta-barrel family protein [Chryseobacterium lactis]
MIKNNIYIISVFLFLFMGIFSNAQSIGGKVSDRKGKGISYIEVIATKDKAKNIAISDENGNFILKLSENGNYLLEVLENGSKSYSRNIIVNGNVINDITINDEKEIQGINLTVKKKLIERKVDRLIFNVENSITSQGGDALDALRITPGLRVQNDQVTMIGKNGMAVMIDDRPVRLLGNDLINYLKSIPSDNIKNIEVITTPPAKYDAEGNSGIVNIKFKKAKKNTISGNIRTSYTQAKYSLGNLGGGLNYQKNKLTLTSNLNYSNGSIAPYQEYTILYPGYTWFETNIKRIFQNNLSGSISLDYQMTPKTNMGLQYSGSYSKPLLKGANTSNINKSQNSVLDSLIATQSRLVEERKIHSFNFHSLTKIDTIGRQYSIDVDYLKFKSGLDNDFNTNTYFPDGNPVPNRFISANNLSNQDIDIYSAKIDYEMPLQWFNLSFGAKVSFMNNNSTVDYFNTTAGRLLDTSKSNIFNYKENTQALYISGNKELSKKWNLQLGIRAENTQMKGYSGTLDQANKNKYIKFFPTFYLTYTADENSVWGLNYNRRIDRPSYSDLNPFRFYTSSFNYSEGNPFLQPFYTDNIEVSFNHDNSYFALYGSYISNKFDDVTFVNPENNIQHIFPLNFYNKLNYGVLWYYTFDKLHWWESNLHTNLYYSKIFSDIENTIADINRWAISLNVNNSFILNTKKTLKAELNFNYQSPSVAGSYKTSSYYYFDMGVRYTLLNKRVQLGLSVVDLFKTNKQTFTQIVNGIEQRNFDYKDTQKFRLTLSWNFGKTLNREQKEKSNEEEKNRLK